eukprot:TRINITY_DN61773_c0_g1_i1.p1 TRINITY_DN61773_c0_g1~~TRINITY_DN61773_c0_g1_i1.p1  ORF type:complete len:292 (+),score=63.12 TRINITY_DN61773_c0_g1_i1:175-1050(+)
MCIRDRVRVGAVPNLRDVARASKSSHSVTLRPGRLFRSSHCFQQNDIDELGIQTQIDLRSHRDLEHLDQTVGSPAAPVRHTIEMVGCWTAIQILRGLPGCGVCRLICCMCARESRAAYVLESITSQPNGLGALYIIFLTHCGEAFVEAARLLCDGASYPVLIQCIHGKDRIGLLVALVLLACGVMEKDVCDDYQSSGPLLANADAKGELDLYIRPWCRSSAVLASPRKALSDALGWLHERHGHASATIQQAARAYLVHHGLTTYELQLVRSHLIDAAGPPSPAQRQAQVEL